MVTSKTLIFMVKICAYNFRFVMHSNFRYISILLFDWIEDGIQKRFLHPYIIAWAYKLISIYSFGIKIMWSKISTPKNTVKVDLHQCYTMCFSLHYIHMIDLKCMITYICLNFELLLIICDFTTFVSLDISVSPYE